MYSSNGHNAIWGYVTEQLVLQVAMLLQVPQLTRGMLLLQGACYFYKGHVTFTRGMLLLQGACYFYKGHVTFTRGMLLLQGACYFYKGHVTFTRGMLLLQGTY